MVTITLARTRQIGGSLVVTLPRTMVEHEGLYKDELVEIRVQKVKKSFRGALKGMGSFKKEDKYDIKDYS